MKNHSNKTTPKQNNDMARPSKLSINVKAILKDHLRPSGEKTFLNCAVWPSKKDGPGHFYITQEVSKEAREQGIKGPILGNLKMEDEEESRPAPRQQSATSVYKGKNAYVPPTDEGSDEIPF